MTIGAAIPAHKVQLSTLIEQQTQDFLARGGKVKVVTYKDTVEFRVAEQKRLNGMDATAKAAHAKAVCNKYANNQTIENAARKQGDSSKAFLARATAKLF